ncbi:MAG TPA: WYL domain-containing protein [Gemmatimonadales bacterium]|nr:WYL domain-containing protein [Gemmatimonadales bacterium]
MNSPKIQRWIDLLAALLTRRFPVTLDDLTREVPAYGKGQGKDALRRMFERDKDELRAFGVRIETIGMPEGDAVGYRLLARDFYLPYLALMEEGRAARPRKLDRDGYRALPTVTFEPDELAAVAAAGARVRELGDPLLAEHAESALRKLAVDLPLDAARPGDARVAPARPAADPRLFEVLGAALEHRKRVKLEYHSMGDDASGPRTVEPYGLFFLNQHWYLAARTDGDAIVKNYRLSRIGGAEENASKPGTPDYEIPAGFRLQEHARSKQAWELGDGDAVEAVVETRRTDGAALAAARLGDPVPDHPDRRRFQVRRRDAFARWLLSFGGDMIPLAPRELVNEYAELASRTLAVYAGGTA